MIWAVFLTTLTVGLGGTLLAACLGFPLGVWLGPWLRQSTFRQAVLLGPLLMSPVVLAYGWMHWLGTFGFEYGLLLVLAVCGLINTPWVAVQVGLVPIPLELIGQARSLGKAHFEFYPSGLASFAA